MNKFDEFLKEQLQDPDFADEFRRQRITYEKTKHYLEKEKMKKKEKQKHRRKNDDDINIL